MNQENKRLIWSIVLVVLVFAGAIYGLVRIQEFNHKTEQQRKQHEVDMEVKQRKDYVVAEHSALGFIEKLHRVENAIPHSHWIRKSVMFTRGRVVVYKFKNASFFEVVNGDWDAAIERAKGEKK